MKSGQGESVKLSLRVVPGARKNDISFAAGVWRVRLTAPPVNGKANRALVDFLADRLDINRSQVTLIAGLTGRNKRVEIGGLSLEDINMRLANK